MERGRKGGMSNAVKSWSQFSRERQREQILFTRVN